MSEHADRAFERVNTGPVVRFPYRRPPCGGTAAGMPEIAVRAARPGAGRGRRGGRARLAGHRAVRTETRIG